MLNFFTSSFEPEINAKTLQALLDEIVTSRLLKRGFDKKSNYSWRKDDNEFRQAIGYMRLKGAAGTFTWGINIDFIPIVHGNKLEYYRTEKRFMMHLWESPSQYKSSFSGRDIRKGIASHWGLKKAKATITDLFNRYEDQIFKWFEHANSIDNLIDIAAQQVQEKNFYNIHSPRPEYILAFLHAKANNCQKALEFFETLDMYQFNNNLELKEKVKQKMLSLSVQ